MKLINALILFCLSVCFVFAQHPEKRRREDSFWGLHFDRHSTLRDTLLGRTLTEGMLDTLLKKARPDFIQVDCKGHAGVSSYPTLVGQQAASYEKDPLALIRKLTEAHNVALYVHYSGVQDHQYVKRHPEDARITPEGKSDEKNASLWGPYVDRLLIPQMKELIDKYHIDGAWIDGECWSVQPDYHPAALEAFTKKTGISDIPRSKDDAHYKAFLEFNREKFIAYLDHYTRILHAHAPEFQICSNWAYSSMMPELVTVGLDFLSGDFDPRNALNTAVWQSRCLSGQGKPWDLMAWSFTADWSGRNLPRNPKTAVQLCQEAAEVLAMGGGYQVYFKQNSDISMQPSGFDVMKHIADFVLPRREFCHKAVPVPQIGLFYSTAGWKAKTNAVYSSSDTGPIQGVLSALLDGQHSVEVLMSHQLERRLDQYPVIVIPEWEYIEPAIGGQLKKYVRDGGNLLVIGAKATQLFDDMCDITDQQPVALSSHYLGYDSRLAQVKSDYRPVEVAGKTKPFARMFSTTDFRFPAGIAAAVSPYGKGKVAAVYADIGDVYRVSTSPVIRDFLSGILEALLPEPLVMVEGSHKVHVVPATKDGRLFVNLVNTSGDHANPNYSGFDEIPSLTELKVSVKLDKKPSGVILQPEGTKVKVSYANGQAVFVVPELKIHTVIELR
jgi:hypothetical protein